MTDLPDYSSLTPPAETPPEAYDHHERRAEIFDVLVQRGEPAAVNQRRLAERYDVADSTISRDMDRLRESVGEYLGTEAKFTTRLLYQHVVDDLLDADDWRASKAAWDVVTDWNDWLADIGEQEREPSRAEVDVDMETRATELSYTVVRDETDLPTDEAGGVDYASVGFTKAPAEVDVEAVEEVPDADE